MINYLYIAIGSALGGMARYWCINSANILFGSTFPWGTLIVNIIGSLVIGLCAGLLAGKFVLSTESQQFMMVGVCGGYTTFSSFSLDSFKLLQKAEILKYVANMGLSVMLCLLAVSIGFVVMSYINK